MAATEKRLRKRRKCVKCGEIFSHSGYYLHIYGCQAERKEQEFEDESESDTFSIGTHCDESSEFQLSDDNEDITVCVPEEQPGK